MSIPVSDLDDYFQGGTTPTPPTGKYFLEGTLQNDELSDSDKYAVGEVTVGTLTETRAYLKAATNTAEKFYVSDKSSTGSGSSGGAGGVIN